MAVGLRSMRTGTTTSPAHAQACCPGVVSEPRRSLVLAGLAGSLSCCQHVKVVQKKLTVSSWWKRERSNPANELQLPLHQNFGIWFGPSYHTRPK